MIDDETEIAGGYVPVGVPTWFVGRALTALFFFHPYTQVYEKGEKPASNMTRTVCYYLRDCTPRA
jgi:hypothetical protein